MTKPAPLADGISSSHSEPQVGSCGDGASSELGTRKHACEQVGQVGGSGRAGGWVRAGLPMPAELSDSHCVQDMPATTGPGGRIKRAVLQVLTPQLGWVSPEKQHLGLCAQPWGPSTHRSAGPYITMGTGPGSECPWPQATAALGAEPVPPRTACTSWHMSTRKWLKMPATPTRGHGDGQGLAPSSALRAPRHRFVLHLPCGCRRQPLPPFGSQLGPQHSVGGHPACRWQLVARTLGWAQGC